MKSFPGSGSKNLRFVINVFSCFSAALLFVIGWKKKTIQKNCEITKINISRFSLYKNACADLISFLLAFPMDSYEISPRDRRKLNQLKNSGGLLLCAHIHNWELMGAWLRNNGAEILGYSQELKQNWANCLLSSSRKKIGLPTISTQVPHKALSWIQSKKIFAVLWDQYYPGAEGVFFNQTVRCSNLPTFLSRNSGCRVYFCYMESGGKIRLLHLNPRRSISALKLLSRYHKILEAAILKEPHFWYGWFHNRFKELSVLEKVSRETAEEFHKRFHVKLESKPL